MVQNVPARTRAFQKFQPFNRFALFQTLGLRLVVPESLYVLMKTVDARTFFIDFTEIGEVCCGATCSRAARKKFYLA